MLRCALLPTGRGCGDADMATTAALKRWQAVWRPVDAGRAHLIEDKYVISD